MQQNHSSEKFSGPLRVRLVPSLNGVRRLVSIISQIHQFHVHEAYFLTIYLILSSNLLPREVTFLFILIFILYKANGKLLNNSETKGRVYFQKYCLLWPVQDRMNHRGLCFNTSRSFYSEEWNERVQREILFEL